MTTFLGALTKVGLVALMTIEGATTGQVFSAFVSEVLAPKLQAGNVVVLDNLAAHKVKEAREAVEARGARLLFLPPYSPELNAIEEGWSKVKEHLRSKEPRSTAEIDSALADAAKSVTSADAIGWIQHAGYHVQK